MLAANEPMPGRGPRTVAKYSAFGYVLESPIELPELDRVPSSTPPTWTLEVDPRASAADRGPIASDTVYDSVSVHAYSTGGAIGLAFDDTGCFEIRPASRVIAWQPGPNTSEAAVRADLLGRVMALAAHADGALALHASAVSIGGQAIAFLGPKHAGKSTIALALARHGARLITDDTLIVRMDASGRPWGAPGVQRVRLWPDAARALAIDISTTRDAKPTVDCLTAFALERAPVPLVACYTLEHASAGTDEPVCRRRLSAVHAALACVRFSKLGALAGGSLGATLLDRAAAVANIIPVFTASVTRDLGRLDQVAAEFLAWHAAHDVSAVPARET